MHCDPEDAWAPIDDSPIRNFLDSCSYGPDICEIGKLLKIIEAVINLDEDVIGEGCEVGCLGIERWKLISRMLDALHKKP